MKVVGVALALLVVFVVAVRMGSHHPPTIDLLGSYFPAWMICIVSGLTLTLIAHWILQVRNLKTYLSPLPLIYTCLTVIYTFVTWIMFYQN